MGYALLSYCKDSRIKTWSINQILKYPIPNKINTFYNKTTDIGGFVAYESDSDSIKFAF